MRVLYASFRADASGYEIDKFFLVVFGMYAVMPYVMAVYLPERLDSTVVDDVSIYCVLLTLAGFLLGCRSGFVKHLSNLDLRLDGPWEKRESGLASGALILIGFCLLVLLVSHVGINTYLNADYVESYAAEAGNGYLSAGLFLVEVGLLTALMAFSDSGKRLSWPPVMFFIALSLVILRTGRRRYVLEMGLGFLAICQLYLKPFRKQTLIAGVALGAFMFVVVGEARAVLSQGFAGMTAYVTEEFSADEFWHLLDEPQSFPLTLHETIEAVPAQQPFYMGLTYLQGFEDLVPYKLHPSRPLAASQWFAQMYNPRLAALGGGYS